MIPRLEEASGRHCRLSLLAGGWRGLLARQLEGRTTRFRLDHVSQNRMTAMAPFYIEASAGTLT
jgi:hypothetical protein